MDRHASRHAAGHTCGGLEKHCQGLTLATGFGGLAAGGMGDRPEFFHALLSHLSTAGIAVADLDLAWR